jgi:hypothetical protein
MMTAAHSPSCAVPRIGSLQPLMAVLPATLSRHGLVWSPEVTDEGCGVSQPDPATVRYVSDGGAFSRNAKRQRGRHLTT